MAKNKITINITPCDDTVTGYVVFYRPIGSDMPFRESPQLPAASPLVVIDENDPPDTEYEGNVVSICRAGLSQDIPFSTAPDITWEGIDCDCVTVPVCEEGYTLSPDGTTCIKENTTDPDFETTLVSIQNVAYGTCGTYIYESYDEDGNGTRALIPQTNAFWTNQNLPLCESAAGTLIDGPLNKIGLWTPIATSGQDVGFSFYITVPISKTYYIGIGADDAGIIKIDGVQIINKATESFRYFHVYPIALTAGDHLIELIGHNGIGIPPNPATIGAEVYNATAAELIAATSYEDLGDKLIFSTKDYIGQPSCAEGYSLRYEDGVYSCVEILTEEPAQQNTGEKFCENRRRLANGIPDGYQEPNIEGEGIGPYFPPEETEDCAP